MSQPMFDASLLVSRQKVEKEARFPVEVVPTLESLWDHFARNCADLIAAHNRDGRKTVLVLPTGPFDYKRLAVLANKEKISFRNVVSVNMDEFCDAQGKDISYDHPLSFRRYMDRELFHRLDPELRIKEKNVVFPSAVDPTSTTKRIEAEGGVDVCYGGFGIDGHFAFNMPESVDVDAYASLPTRVLTLTPESRTQSALGSTSGDIASVPPRAVTVGMREMLAAREVRVYLMCPWQSSVMRRCLYGPVTAFYPASLLQRHPRLKVVMVSYVADEPKIGPG
jgi:glucosamine-6-phosphate deaminase